MATKKSKLGFDPLAWMQDEGEAETKAESVKMTAKKTAAKPTKNVIGLEADILRSSFDLLAPKIDEVVSRFYDELFLRFPVVKPMFANTTKAKQTKMLVASLKLVIRSEEHTSELQSH